MHRLKICRDVLKACLEKSRRSIKQAYAHRDEVGAGHEAASVPNVGTLWCVLIGENDFNFSDV
jgi:hypothetical protein